MDGIGHYQHNPFYHGTRFLSSTIWNSLGCMEPKFVGTQVRLIGSPDGQIGSPFAYMQVLGKYCKYYGGCSYPVAVGGEAVGGGDGDGLKRVPFRNFFAL